MVARGLLTPQPRVECKNIAPPKRGAGLFARTVCSKKKLSSSLCVKIFETQRHGEH